MAIVWRRHLGISALDFNIGHPDQQGLLRKWDEDGFRKYQIKLIIAASTRAAFEITRDNLLIALRIMPIRMKDLGWRGKYIIPNGSPGFLITASETTPLIFPESIQITDQEISAAFAVATFKRAL